MKLLSYLLLDAALAVVVFFVLWLGAKKLVAAIKSMFNLAKAQRVKTAARAQGSCAIRVVQPRTDDIEVPVLSSFAENVDWAQYDVPTYFRRMINGTATCRVAAPASETEVGSCVIA